MGGAQLRYLAGRLRGATGPGGCKLGASSARAAERTPARPSRKRSFPKRCSALLRSPNTGVRVLGGLSHGDISPWDGRQPGAVLRSAPPRGRFATRVGPGLKRRASLPSPSDASRAAGRDGMPGIMPWRLSTGRTPLSASAAPSRSGRGYRVTISHRSLSLPPRTWNMPGRISSDRARTWPATSDGQIVSAVHMTPSSTSG